MNRRSFLGRFVVGAAAVLGLGAVRVAEASVPATVSRGELTVSGQSVLTGNGLWIEPGSLSNEYALRVHSDAAVERAVVYGGYPKTLYLRAGTFTSDEVREWMRQSGARRIEGSGADKTTIVVGDTPIMVNGGVSGVHVEHLTVEPPTFEAMAADCAAHGCSFSYEHATGPDGRRWAKVTHGGVWKNWHLDFSGGEADILDQIDAERRELHED